MVHRRSSHASQPSEMDHIYTWNHQNPNPRSRLGNNSFMSTMDNSATSGVDSVTYNIAPGTNSHPTSSFGLDYLNHRASNLQRFQNMHASSAGSCIRSAPNHAPHMPCYSQPMIGDGCNTVNPQIDNRRATFKRKSPEMPLVAERASVSGYYSAGSSSNFPISSDYLQPKPIPVPQCWPLNSMYTVPSSNSDNLLIVGEGSQRNVRRRHGHTFHLEHNPPGAYPSINIPYHSSSTGSMSGRSMAEQWSQTHVSGTPRGRILFSENGYYNHEPNQSLVASNINNGTAAMNAVYHPNIIRNWSSLPNLHVPPPQGVVPGQSNHDQRMTLYRTISSHPIMRFAATSSEGGATLEVEAAASSRQPRPMSIVGHGANVRGGGRVRNFYNTFHSLFNGANPHDRWVSEGIVMINQPTFYDPSNLFDPYRDMRLDVDNMSYEELLALEESIGNVSTGLAEDRISACLIKGVHCSNQAHDDQEERSCAICLEEYKDRDNLGSMKCGHDFHVGCIKKWLEIKKVCPICKASALEDISEKQISPF